MGKELEMLAKWMRKLSFGNEEGFKNPDPSCDHSWKLLGSSRVGTEGRGRRIAVFREIYRCEKCSGNKWGKIRKMGLMPGEF